MTTPAAAPREGTPKRTIGRPFEKGHHRGRPKGIVDRRRLAGAMAAKAIEARAWDVVFALLQARAWRPRFEAARLVLAYSVGLPKATLELTGGVGDLARELAAALAAVRERRAVLEGLSTAQANLALPEAISAAPVEPGIGGAK